MQGKEKMLLIHLGGVFHTLWCQFPLLSTAYQPLFLGMQASTCLHCTISNSWTDSHAILDDGAEVLRCGEINPVTWWKDGWIVNLKYCRCGTNQVQNEWTAFFFIKRPLSRHHMVQADIVWTEVQAALLAICSNQCLCLLGFGESLSTTCTFYSSAKCPKWCAKRNPQSNTISQCSILISNNACTISTRNLT